MYPGYVKAFRELADSPDTEITYATFLDEEGDPKPALINQAGQLQWVLVTLCTGSAAAMLRRENTSNGFEPWRKLYNRYDIPLKGESRGQAHEDPRTFMHHIQPFTNANR